MHRDVQGKNIIVSTRTQGQQEAKLVNFGATHFHIPCEGKSSIKPNSRCGTPGFMAPEMFEAAYDEKADVFSFVALCYYVFELDSEGKHRSPNHQINEIKYGEAKSHIHRLFQEIMKTNLVLQPDKRQSMQDIVDQLSEDMQNNREKYEEKLPMPRSPAEIKMCASDVEKILTDAGLLGSEEERAALVEAIKGKTLKDAIISGLEKNEEDESDSDDGNDDESEGLDGGM